MCDAHAPPEVGGRVRGRYLVLAAALWLLALGVASGGLWLGRAVFDRGVAYGAALPVLPDVSVARRAVNTQLELERSGEDVRRSLRLIKSAGFGWIRQQFAWDSVETSSKGRYDWRRTDDIISAARMEGLDVLARIDLPPAWARPAGSFKTHPPTDVRDFEDFVHAFVERYRGQVRYVQLWNEPNLNEEWGRRTVDPASYAELLRAGYGGAKRADPSVRVVSGALAQTLEPDDKSARGLDDLLYLERLYLAGAKPYFDVLAANAYGLARGPDDRRVAPEDANFPRVLLVRDVMLRHGDAGKAVWVAEFGWNALPPGWTGEPSPWGHVQPDRQARYIVGAYERAAAEWPWLGPMALWLFRKPAADARDPTPYFALVDDSWQPRPAYDALAAHPADVLGAGVHQETSPQLAFGGLWQWTPDRQAQLGEMRESPISGATLRFRFRGTQVDVVAPAGPARGSAFVKINGAYTLANRLPLNPNGQAILDFYASSERAQQRRTLASGLPDRVHDVELTVTGEKQPASSGAGIGIDAIVVSRARPVFPVLAAAGAWGVTGIGLAWLLVPRGRLLATPLSVLLHAGALRGAVYLTAALLPLAPLGLRTPIGTYSPIELACLVCICLWLLRVFAGVDERRRGAYAGPATLLVLAGLLSTWVADYPRLALRELRTVVIEPALFYCAARSVLIGRRDAQILAASFVAGAGAASVLAILQTVAGRNLVTAEGVTRAAALYRSPNNLALLLDRAFPMALAGALYAARPARALFGVAAALGAGALFVTFSRGAWLACAVAALGVFMPWLAEHFTRSRRGLLLVAVALVPLIAGAVLVAAQFERFSSLFSGAGTSFLRLHLWSASVRMALDHAVFGVGLDQFLYHYPRYMHPDAWREPNLSHPHQIVLDFWLRLGVLGVAAVAWAGVAHRRVMRAGGPAALRLGAAGAVLALLLHGLVDNSFFLLDLAYATWIVLLVAELNAEASWQP
ncbi:MAG: O-antigen ligase family protein [Chloroflexota bacterium]